ncbi:zonular occludens toxin domain-containing protein [Pseudomonas sp. Gutcm_11s]|uniref:zonular occludens toxin domain-containing protein n=1 Tax=Pseudomonas sp. Gutcm_11s TaxID=3026088 RepID=UPI002360B2F7|nr:zonular occludens toxin domain-containing protein [Pseudomonas sp. Gutcm_11s]MDD0844625.1 zonular occludens toxin domain-containing protein [Pseudomonas sp. Gutcm_11s]
MLYIRTGKPGHGKTLNTIREVDAKAFDEGRPVYFHNINGLKPELLKASWFKFDDPELWFDLPPNSIVVVDEAQGWFGARDTRARPPEHITRFETMRHSGHEVHLVTQDPRYIDVHLRRLCNGHVHYWRVFKSQQLLRFESDAVIEKVEIKSSFKDADKKTVRLDKKYFGVYTSANASHHFQTKLPTKFLLAMAVIGVAGFMVYRAYERYELGKETTPAEQGAPTSEKGLVDQVKGSVGSLINPVANASGKEAMTTAKYIALRTPRIPDVPSSAPIYDELTKPKTYPKLSCVMSSDEGYIERNRKRYQVVRAGQKAYICECFSQQGTWHKTSFSFCRNTVQHGYFDAAIADRGSTQDGMPKQPATPPPTQPLESQQQADGGIKVVQIPYEKGRFLW